MSGIDRQLQQAFHDLVFKEGELFPAVVQSVDKKKKSLTVVDAEAIEYTDVRLTATLSEQDKIACYPKPQSSVLLAKIGGSPHTLVCVAYSELEALEGKIEDTTFLVDKDGLHAKQNDTEVLADKDGFHLKQGDTEFLADKDGFHLDRKGKNLYKTFEKLFEQVQKLCEEVAKVVVSVGTPVNVAEVNQIKQQVHTLVNGDLNEILKPHKDEEQKQD